MTARILVALGVAGLVACIASAGWRHREQERERRARRELCESRRARGGEMAAMVAAEKLPAFSIDKTEVTVAAYRACVAASACETPVAGKFCNFSEPGRDADPVNCVTRAEADAFCAWVGRRLPTREEWIAAACAPESSQYAFSAQLTPEMDCYDRHDIFSSEGALSKLVTPAKGTCPVDAHPKGATSQGVLGLAANVSEWTSSEPQGATRGQSNRAVFMGANWISRNDKDRFRCDRETPAAPVYQDSLIGFRCAANAEP